jgi:hypothetical protein
MTYIPSFINIGSDVQKSMGGHTDTHLLHSAVLVKKTAGQKTSIIHSGFHPQNITLNKVVSPNPAACGVAHAMPPLGSDCN